MVTQLLTLGGINNTALKQDLIIFSQSCCLHGERSLCRWVNLLRRCPKFQRPLFKKKNSKG